jgi:hypothetical protein
MTMQLVRITPTKTTAIEASAIKAAEAKFGETDLRYLVPVKKLRLAWMEQCRKSAAR